MRVAKAYHPIQWYLIHRFAAESWITSLIRSSREYGLLAPDKLGKIQNQTLRRHAERVKRIKKSHGSQLVWKCPYLLSFTFEEYVNLQQPDNWFWKITILLFPASSQIRIDLSRVATK